MLCYGTFKFYKTVLQQIWDEVTAFISAFSAVPHWMQKWRIIEIGLHLPRLLSQKIKVVYFFVGHWLFTVGLVRTIKIIYYKSTRHVTDLHGSQNQLIKTSSDLGLQLRERIRSLRPRPFVACSLVDATAAASTCNARIYDNWVRGVSKLNRKQLPRFLTVSPTYDSYESYVGVPCIGLLHTCVDLTACKRGRGWARETIDVHHA